MYPHERSLVEKYKDRPFTILGVNSDEDREELKKTIDKEKLHWPSFWDGGSTYGPIAMAWNVSGWPTLYLIDHKGVFLKLTGRDEEMDKQIEEAVQKAEADKKK